MAERITDTKIIAKEIRTELKKQFPKCKFSVTRDYNSISIALMSAPVSPFVDSVNSSHEQLNHNIMWLKEDKRLTDEAKEMFEKVISIFNKRNWDNCDYMNDYFDVNFYQNLQIGKWDKPFVIK